MKKGVLTTYYIDNVPYSSYILGDCMTRISNAVRERGLGESIDSGLTDVTPLTDYSSLSDEELNNRLPEVLHALCYISFIALNSKKASVAQVLGDHGLIHEIAHILSNVESCNKKSLGETRDLIKAVQLKAVGLYEPV
ncbi:MAG: hypothetical protein HYZ15_00600 [Sphingobacteriales bacterium]|nr:hypothetical protein [Sphingobacteriales bacterium]